jgi:hypothetical protein
MKIEIPKVLATVDLGEYAPELKGKFLCVWVNLPADVLTEHFLLAAKVKADDPNAYVELLNWYARIWSQGTAETHWTLDELRELEQRDASFLSWMISATWSKYAEHKSFKKKA